MSDNKKTWFDENKNHLRELQINRRDAETQSQKLISEIQNALIDYRKFEAEFAECLAQSIAMLNDNIEQHFATINSTKTRVLHCYDQLQTIIEPMNNAEYNKTMSELSLLMNRFDEHLQICSRARMIFDRLLIF